MYFALSVAQYGLRPSKGPQNEPAVQWVQWSSQSRQGRRKSWAQEVKEVQSEVKANRFGCLFVCGPVTPPSATTHLSSSPNPFSSSRGASETSSSVIVSGSLITIDLVVNGLVRFSTVSVIGLACSISVAFLASVILLSTRYRSSVC